MAVQPDSFAKILRQIQTLREQLRNPNLPLVSGRPLMKQIGILGVAASQKAFRDQALGEIKWPPRYPSQGKPKFNVAGAIMDWKGGRTSPKPNRFQDRPANIDTMETMNRLSYSVSGNLDVTWGSNTPQAPKMQAGGVTVIRYDAATKARMANWLYVTPPQRGKAFGRKVRQNKVKTGLSGTKKRAEYERYIAPLIAKNRNEWKQTVIARPFVGVTDELENDIAATVKLYYEKAQR